MTVKIPLKWVKAYFGHVYKKSRWLKISAFIDSFFLDYSYNFSFYHNYKNVNSKNG